MIGQTSTRNCRAPLSKASRFFFHSSMTIRPSNVSSVLQENSTRPDAVPIRGKRALPPIRDLLESGKIVALDFPAGENPGLARAVAVMLKMDFQRAMLNRIAKMAAEPERQWRPVLFVCDEYQQVATVTEHEPNGDDAVFQPLPAGKVHSYRRNAEHQFSTIHVAG